jgi:hypothetical protein
VCARARVCARVCARVQNKLQQTPWPESASELYRPSDRRLSAAQGTEFSFSDLDVKDPTLFRQSAHRWRQGCQPY